MWWSGGHLGFEFGSPVFDSELSYTWMQLHIKMEVSTSLIFQIIMLTTCTDRWETIKRVYQNRTSLNLVLHYILNNIPTSSDMGLYNMHSNKSGN